MLLRVFSLCPATRKLSFNYFTARGVRTQTGIHANRRAEHAPSPSLRPLTQFSCRLPRGEQILLFSSRPGPTALGHPARTISEAYRLCGVPARHEIGNNSCQFSRGAPGWPTATRTRPSHSLAAAAIEKQLVVSHCGWCRKTKYGKRSWPTSASNSALYFVSEGDVA